jgi:predicted nucleic acid-binding protein
VAEDAWVVNASPLILYARIRRLDLLEQLAPDILVPNTVIGEVRGGAWKDQTAHIAVDWAMPRRCPDAAVPASVERWDLGAGESQVIRACLAEERWAVLDDRMARRCATAHGILTIGSLGIILRARERGMISNARYWITKLKSAGMYVADDLINRCVLAIGEDE